MNIVENLFAKEWSEKQNNCKTLAFEFQKQVFSILPKVEDSTLFNLLKNIVLCLQLKELTF